MGSSSSYLLTGLTHFSCKQFSSSGAYWLHMVGNPNIIDILGYVTENAGITQNKCAK